LPFRGVFWLCSAPHGHIDTETCRGSHVIEQYLGLGNGRHEGEEALLAETRGEADAAAARLMATLQRKPRLAPEAVDALLARVHARREAVGFGPSYREWLERVTPSDLA
jgi:hypothetical protein